MKKKVIFCLASTMLLSFALAFAGCDKKHEHDFSGAETIIKEATCTEEGSKTVKCIHCDETTVVAIPMREHDFNETTHLCGVCGAADPAAAEAQIGTTYYLSLAEAVRAGGTVKLLKDVDLKEGIVVTNEVTLDLNGKRISNSVDLWSNTIWSLIGVDNGGVLTITGNGEMIAKENDCYALDVSGGELVIESGTFVGNISAVYVYRGKAEIKGGTFSIQQLNAGAKPYVYLLNLLDGAGKDGTASISVTGGSFVNFDPSHAESENPVANFVADGFTVTAETADGGTVYTVSAEA